MSDKERLAEDRTDWAEDRTVLANERTFAGWMRTGMGAIAVAVGLQAVFREFEPTWVAKGGATVFLTVAVIIFWAAFLNAERTHKRLSDHDTKSQSRRYFLLISSLFTVGTVVTGYVLWLV